MKTLDVRDGATRCNSHLCVFPSAHFSLKPVDIPSFLCCCNANLSAPLKRGRQEEEEEVEEEEEEEVEEEGRNREDHTAQHLKIKK